MLLLLLLLLLFGKNERQFSSRTLLCSVLLSGQGQILQFVRGQSYPASSIHDSNGCWCGSLMRGNENEKKMSVKKMSALIFLSRIYNMLVQQEYHSSMLYTVAINVSQNTLLFLQYSVIDCPRQTHFGSNNGFHTFGCF